MKFASVVLLIVDMELSLALIFVVLVLILVSTLLKLPSASDPSISALFRIVTVPPVPWPRDKLPFEKSPVIKLVVESLPM